MREQTGEGLPELQLPEPSSIQVLWRVRPLSITPQKQHAEQAISMFKEIKAENELALACSGLGPYHKQQRNVEQARKCLTDALKIFERLGTLIEPDKVRKELAELPE
jgi:hypothetical protein